MHQHNKEASGSGKHSKDRKMLEFGRLSFEKILKLYNASLLKEAETLLENHLKIYPFDDAALNISGLIAYQFRHYEAAIELFRTAINLNNQEHAYHNSLGASLKESGNLEEAISCFQKALEINPDDDRAAYNLGNSFHALRELTLAIEWYDYALVRNPDYHKAYNGKACAYKELGMIDTAIEIFQNARQRNLYDATFDSNLLLCLNYYDRIDAETIFEYHREWGSRYAEKQILGRKKHYNDAIPSRRLRVGYVSADFRGHPVAFFINPILIGHDRRNVEVFCYVDVATPDKMTQVIKPNADHWTIIHGMTDRQVCSSIQNDGIDILVDLGGHTANNRMKLFSMKPAPIQVTYLGYPNTTGLSAMDYRITDTVADPPGLTDRYHTEKLIRLPDGFLCYQPATGCPEPVTPPCLKNGFITFGCFCNRVKINSKVIDVWSDLLFRVPGSRLILKSSMDVDENARNKLISCFVERGIEASRIDFLPYLSFEDHMKQYHQVDIALDTFPYNGTTTTCEALWMGVPVITLAGKTHVSRVGLSILSNLAMDDWMASSAEDYAKRAAELANDIENIKYLRRVLRSKFQISSLMDKQRFTLKLEAAYRRMWIDRCAILISDEREGINNIMTAGIPGGLSVCVPNDISCMTSYILQENTDWFEREIPFVREFLKPGMNVVDIGTSYGLYAQTAAKFIGPSGKVWAFEPSRLAAAYLGRSIKANQLTNITLINAGVSNSDHTGFMTTSSGAEFDRFIDNEFSDIKEAVAMTHLDAWVDSMDNKVDFTRMDPLGQDENILYGGKYFFESFSPLVLYKIKNGVMFHSEMIQEFLDIGYRSYRLVPGLKILVPVSIGKRLDAFQMNLFCCKRDRAEALQGQGLLVGIDEIAFSPSDIPSSLWIDYLQNFPYMVRLLSLWEAFCTDHASDPDWQVHQHALNAYAISRSQEYNISDRYAALVTSYDLMTELLKAQPKVSRILTTIRITNDLGYREESVNWLNHLYHFFESAHDFSLDEPFLAVSERMEGLDPGNEIGQWLIYGVLEIRELCHAYSSYFSGKKSLPELEMMLTSPFCSEEMKRRHHLIIERFGMELDGGGQRTES